MVLETIHKTIKWLTIPLVIAGIVLSTLHQSSLGSLLKQAMRTRLPMRSQPTLDSSSRSIRSSVTP